MREVYGAFLLIQLVMHPHLDSQHRSSKIYRKRFAL
jgi:hypothetical protein